MLGPTLMILRPTADAIGNRRKGARTSDRASHDIEAVIVIVKASDILLDGEDAALHRVTGLVLEVTNLQTMWRTWRMW